MRKVLITQRLVKVAEYPEERDALDVRWAPFLAAAGLVPVPVPSGVEPGAFVDALGDVAGLVLSGGNDVSTVSEDPLSRRRDALEAALCERLAGRPVLGVCRGLQFLASRDGLRLQKLAGHAGSRHRLTVKAGARWLWRHDGVEVNSYHQFGLREGAGWVATALAPDGTIEALEHPAQRRVGIMWHPEREAPFHPADLALFKELFE